VANTGFEGGCDGRGCVCGTFLVICTQPSHAARGGRFVVVGWPEMGRGCRDDCSYGGYTRLLRLLP
jgi:hypothetical protein